MPGRRALVGEQHLETLARRRRRGALALEHVENAHAALRPKILPNRPRFSPGTETGIVSPHSRRAACM